ncbi:MAG: polysaccharide export protein Wza [Candidatus Accumulibacter appositus]|uniref:Polysaccharide export protein Wza n=1 Tax=Candidatus Accumulibacter appositus TaxID=1454003 RepID=A0A011QEL4_9PROT|nr:XrtA/PEP-CTERM system exopolysaccharide export protein [Accumulibacter sp.]EXI77224.1 MAG: polysaccharide export protein Wza [Candidatus Accumulibacter appositus]HRF03979.1 polysaccharide export protein [Accumulibacter sp.]
MVSRLHHVVGAALRWLVLGAAGALAVGCASSDFPPAPELAASPDYRYLIGPGDTVNIIVWRNPELSLSVPVRPDGLIAGPLIEDMPAMGKTPTMLARDMEKALGVFIRDPVVTVVVTSFVGSQSEQIRVVGEASKPQALPYRQKMTLLDVMIAVGGLTDFADGNGATLLRVSDDTKEYSKENSKQYSVRLYDLIRRGDVSANVDMKPGDVLIIPQSWF